MKGLVEVCRRRRGLGIALFLGILLAAPGCQSPKLDAQGRPITVGRLRLRTFPSGAKVWIDGELRVEATPATLILPSGIYQLRLQLKGAESLERTIEIEAGEARELDLNLPRPPDATITVLSDVVGAKVLINGYTRGETPLVEVVTKPGPIDLTVLTPNGHARSVRDVLSIGEAKRIEVFFGEVASVIPESAPAPIPMSQPPPAGAVTLGLEPEGSIFDEEERRLGATPLNRYPLPEGEHRLLLRSRDGRFEKWVTVEVKAGQTAIYRFRLRPEDEVPGWRPDGG